MKDVTFIIQGGIEEHEVNDVIQRSKILEFFPESKIIISIWGESVSTRQIAKNIIQISNGPAKQFTVSGERWAVNFENQCASTLAGLNLCDTGYAVKFRSDCFFKGDNLRSIFDKFISSDKSLLVNAKSITFPYPFYGVDYFQIGQTETLKEIWKKSFEISIDLNKYEEFEAHYFDRRNNFTASLHPEQVLYFAQFGSPIKYRDYVPRVQEFMEGWCKFEKTNFCIGRKNLQVGGLKHSNSVFDYCPYIFSLTPFSQVRGLLSLLAGFWSRP